MGVTPRARDGQDDPFEDASLQAAPSGSHSEDLDRLRQTLERDYDALLHRLTNVLRSHDQAADALHDVYLRLGRAPAVGDVRNPIAYIYRMALNLAHNVRRRDLRIVAAPSMLIDQLADETPDPERVALAKQDLGRALAALATLPDQRRDIFLARWRDGLTQVEIAARFALHKRTVQKELARAERFLRTQAGAEDPVAPRR